MSRHRFHVPSPRCGHRPRARRGRSLAVACHAFYRSDFAQPSGTKNPSMTRVRINYDGWLSLPTAVRQKLGLATGDQLELELADGSIILRPVSGPAPVATAGRRSRPPRRRRLLRPRLLSVARAARARPRCRWCRRRSRPVAAGAKPQQRPSPGSSHVTTSSSAACARPASPPAPP